MTSIIITIGTIALAVTCAALVPSAPTVEQGIALGGVALPQGPRRRGRVGREGRGGEQEKGGVAHRGGH